MRKAAILLSILAPIFVILGGCSKIMSFPLADTLLLVATLMVCSLVVLLAMMFSKKTVVVDGKVDKARVAILIILTGGIVMFFAGMYIEMSGSGPSVKNLGVLMVALSGILSLGVLGYRKVLKK